MKNIWLSKRWQLYYEKHSHRNGLRVIYDSNVEPEIKHSCKEFISWLRVQYTFPKRVRMYIKSSKRIKSMYGDMVCGTFYRPYDRDIEPYIKIATGDFNMLNDKWGKDVAIASYLWTITHELTHYFQWLNDIDLTLVGEERQATNYANKIIEEYSNTRDHP